MTDFQGGYGLGTLDFRVVEDGRWDVEVVGHTGETVGYRSVLVVIPGSMVSLAILTPSTVNVVPLVRKLVAAGALLGE
jgi:hypothetical protein